MIFCYLLIVSIFISSVCLTEDRLKNLDFSFDDIFAKEKISILHIGKKLFYLTEQSSLF